VRADTEKDQFNMHMKSRLFTAASIVAVASTAASPVLAAGTTQGTNVTNDVTVSYQVGGVQQSNATASNTFVVDRKVNLTVSESGGAATSVSPGQNGAVTIFTLTNSSNDTLDFGLEAIDQAGGAGKFTGTDNFNASPLTIYRETNGTAGFQAGTGGDTLVTYLDEVAADATVMVYVLGNIPLARVNGDTATIRLTATAQAGGTTGTAGAVLAETAGANTAGVDTVFADDSANGNTARDGKSFDRDDYVVAAATVSATKTSRIVWDPLNLASNPKIIPGAVVEYCIAVANATGSATATNITLSDTLPTETTFLSDTANANYVGIRINGTTTNGACNLDGTQGGSHASGVVTGSLSDIAAGITRTLLFRVVVK